MRKKVDKKNNDQEIDKVDKQSFLREIPEELLIKIVKNLSINGITSLFSCNKDFNSYWKNLTFVKDFIIKPNIVSFSDEIKRLSNLISGYSLEEGLKDNFSDKVRLGSCGFGFSKKLKELDIDGLDIKRLKTLMKMMRATLTLGHLKETNANFEKNKITSVWAVDVVIVGTVFFGLLLLDAYILGAKKNINTSWCLIGLFFFAAEFFLKPRLRHDVAQYKGDGRLLMKKIIEEGSSIFSEINKVKDKATHTQPNTFRRRANAI